MAEIIGDLLNSLPRAIFMLYLILSANFLANLFGCRAQQEFVSNMWLKHLLGFMTMYLSIVLVDSTAKWSASPSVQLGVASAFYVVFVLTTRMDYKWWVAFIIGLCIVYILQVYKDHEKTSEEDKKKYETYQKYTMYVVGAILVVGFLVYYGKKQVEYGKKFNHLTFFLGKSKCAGNREPVKISDYNAVLKGLSISSDK